MHCTYNVSIKEGMGVLGLLIDVKGGRGVKAMLTLARDIRKNLIFANVIIYFSSEVTSFLNSFEIFIILKHNSEILKIKEFFNFLTFLIWARRAHT